VVTMTAYDVQFVLPVDNPEKNVRITRKGKVAHFEVPINHPDAHNMGFMDLLAAAELSGLLGLPTHLNSNKSLTDSPSISIKANKGRLTSVRDPQGSAPPGVPTSEP